MSVITDALKWLKKEFTAVKEVIVVKIVPLAVTIVEAIKTAEANGILTVVANVLSSITDNISVEVNTFINAQIPNVLAALLAIEGLPANPTEAQIEAFENSIVTAIGGKSALAKSQLWTELAAQLYILIEGQLQTSGGTLTYAQIVADVEAGYTQYLADTTANAGQAQLEAAAAIKTE